MNGFMVDPLTVVPDPNNYCLGVAETRYVGQGDLSSCNVHPGVVCVREGGRLEFGGDLETKPFALMCGEVISGESSLVGRSTMMLHATSPKWQDVNLVVKICWPETCRGSESEFLRKATKEAGSSTCKWALGHLPRLLFAQDVTFDQGSTHGRVARLFDHADFVNGEYKDERRTLRIIIQERLYPLTTLTQVKDVAQVLLDVACIHRWLYKKVGILHRDLSLHNIMYRMIDGKAYGVLAEFNLSSWTVSLTGGHTNTSQQKTGTPPYMACGLLKGTDPIHLYRHDLESLFYIMLILATRYEVQAPGREKKGGVRMRRDMGLPFRHWFNQPEHEALGHFKDSFISNTSNTYTDLSEVT